MKVEKKILEKSQVELTVELTVEEFQPHVEKAAALISESVAIEGFRPGKAPLEMVKKKVGEMSILERAAHLAIDKSFSGLLEENLKDEQIVGQPQVEITKLAPGNPLEFKMILAILPAVTLGEYKGLKIEAVKVKIDPKEVDRVIDYLRETRVKEAAVDRGIATGDKVVANISMFLDSVPLEGGQSRDTVVLIGKEYFVPGFDQEIVGAKKGETKEFFLTYPKDFHQKNLAGKKVEFKVEIKEVFSRELPEMTDELAKNFGAPTAADLKNMIESDISGQKSFEAGRKTELNMLEKILEKTKFGEIPEMLLSNEAEKMMIELEENVARQGGKMDDYLASIKKTKEQLVLDLLPEAMKRVKTALLIRELAIVEKIEASDQEVEEKQKVLLEQYKDTKGAVERISDPGYKHYLKNSLTNQKVIDRLKEWNVIGDKEESAGKEEGGEAAKV